MVFKVEVAVRTRLWNPVEALEMPSEPSMSGQPARAEECFQDQGIVLARDTVKESLSEKQRHAVLASSAEAAAAVCCSVAEWMLVGLAVEWLLAGL